MRMALESPFPKPAIHARSNDRPQWAVTVFAVGIR